MLVTCANAANVKAAKTYCCRPSKGNRGSNAGSRAKGTEAATQEVGHLNGRGERAIPVRRSYRPCSSRVVAMHSRLGRLPAKTSRCSFAYFCCQSPQTLPDAGSVADRDRLILATSAIPAMRATSTSTVTGASLRRLLRRRSGMRLLRGQASGEAFVAKQTLARI